MAHLSRPWRLATVTLNGTLDRVLALPDLSLGQIRNIDCALTLAGGKGLNVARTARALGAEVMTTGLIAGQCGQWIDACLAEEKIPRRFFYLSHGESRISTIIVDSNRKQTTVINDLGAKVQAETWSELCPMLVQAIAGYPWVALCGSSLPGLPDSVYADLGRRLQAQGSRVCLDARERWLTQALPSQPYLVKCNHHEAAQALGHAITPPGAPQALQPWLDLGLERVIVTFGPDGAVAVERGNAWWIKAPTVQALCPIGSGDAMMAGIIAALAQGQSLPLATQYGVVVGTANTLVLGSGRCDFEAIPDLIEKTQIDLLS